MVITHKLSMDLAKAGSYSCIEVTQGDAYSRRICMELLSESQPWPVPEGAEVIVRFRRADGTEGVYNELPDGAHAFTVSGSSITVTVIPEVLTHPGHGNLSVTLYKDETELTTWAVDLLIHRNYGSGDTPGGNYVGIAGMIPGPSVAKVGQHFVVTAVDGSGRVVSVQAADAIDGLIQDESGMVYLAAGGVPVGDGLHLMAGGSGGGGGGAVSSYTVTLSNLLPSRVITIPEGTPVNLLLKYSSVDSDGMDDGPGVGQLLVGGIVRQTFSVPQGEFPVDVTGYLAAGTNNISVKVTNSENVTKTMTYTITVVAVSLTSSFDASVPYSGSILFPYTPVGIAEKTVHFELDGSEIGTAIVTTSGRQQSYTIPAQSHGAHVLRVWFTCTIEGTTITSNTLYYSVVCTVEGNMTPIIALTTPPLTSVEQYTNMAQKYRVHDPAGLTAAITLEANGKAVANLTVDRTEQTWSYQPTEVGELTQTIRCGDVSASWTSTVTESSIKVEAETEALALHLSSYGRSNNEENPGTWESNGVSAVFENFNFVSDGWVLDDDDITVLRVTGDARLRIPYRMFAYDFRTTGKTFEIEFATRDVLDYDAEIIRCYSGGRGFVVTAQQMELSSEQSTLGMRYKEEEHIRVSFVVEKRSERRLILCYINGVMSASIQYPDDDDFSQADPVDITIGSNDCTVDLYNIRAYDNSLTRYQILDNWIADTQDMDLKIARYRRNQVYDAYGQVVIGKLPSNLPYLVIECPQLPQFKGDKKKCSGYFVDPLHPERNFSFVDAEIDVQGTSSQYYVIKNFKIKGKNGFILFDGTTVEVYAMNEDAVPVAIFTFKADFASSEGAYNVVAAKLYNQLNPYKFPAMEEDPRVRHTIDGFPMVLFWDNGSQTAFVGKYNFNNDKGTPEPFGLKPGDERWEVLQNGTARVGFHSADFSDPSWKEDFEGNYPDGNTDTTNLQAMCAWVTSTDTEQATGAQLPQAVTFDGLVECTRDTPEYRLAKFDAELEDHFVEEPVIFYYLFTLFFLCMDQREKNVLWRFVLALMRWLADFYDADSIIGHNNQAQPVLDYWLEDIDHTESGDPVFNGQASTFWKNLRATRWDRIKSMYQELRSSGKLSYEVIIQTLEEHQALWPEAIFNEDMAAKYLGENLSYLNFLRGKKELWNKWWLYNRFRYMDTLFEAGSSKENQMTIRVNVKADFFLTAYINMYGRMFFNAQEVTQRMERGKEYRFAWVASGAEDPVVGINDSDLYTSFGDLSPHMVELIDVSKAKRLTWLKLGDGAEGYVNYSLTSVTLGNNTMLRSIDFRNCPNLTQNVDVKGCTNIEEIYLEGSSVTGCTLPNGGVLKTLHLPGTITSLIVRNQTKLQDFSCPDYSKISTLRVENSTNIPTAEIILAMADGGRVRLTGLDWTLTSTAILDKLVKMRGLTETGDNTETAVLSGKLHFDCELSVSTYLMAKDRFKFLEITYKSLKLDVLAEYTGKVWLTSDNKLFMLSDGGHTATARGEVIDMFIAEKMEEG